MDPNMQAIADQLSSRDRRLQGQLQEGGDRNIQADMAQDLTPQNIAELGRALDRATDPRQKQILMEELERLKDMASNLLGPVDQPEPPPGMIPQSSMRRLPYDPRTQQPEVMAHTATPLPRQVQSDIPAGTPGEMLRQPKPLGMMDRIQEGVNDVLIPFMDRYELQGRRSMRGDVYGPMTREESAWDALAGRYRK